MPDPKDQGPALVNEWRAVKGVGAFELAAAIGDRGGQVVKWLNGNRDRLPIRLKVALASYTGIPLDQIADSDELRFARDVFAVMARDAAGRAA